MSGQSVHPWRDGLRSRFPLSISTIIVSEEMPLKSFEIGLTQGLSNFGGVGGGSILLEDYTIISTQAGRLFPYPTFSNINYN